MKTKWKKGSPPGRSIGTFLLWNESRSDDEFVVFTARTEFDSYQDDEWWYFGPIQISRPLDVQARQNRAACKELEALLSYIKQSCIDVTMIKHGIGEVETTVPGDIARTFASTGRGDSLTITWDKE